MAGYAYLDAFEPIDRILTPPEVEGKHNVPLFWLAMFEPGDLHAEKLEGVRYRDRPVFSIGPYLRTDAKVASARLAKRVPALTAIIGATHQPLLKQWLSFTKRLKPAVVVRLEDLAVDAGKDFVSRIRGALEVVSKLDEGAAIDVASLMVEPLTSVWAGAEWQADEHAGNLLTGWGWQVTAEERAQRARERKWQKAVGERPPGELVPYVMTRVYTPDELVHHPSLGNGIVLRVVEGSKVEILFRDGPKTLIHARAPA